MKRLVGRGRLAAAAGLSLVALAGSSASAQAVDFATLPAQADMMAVVDQALEPQSLVQLVQANLDGAPLDEELSCLATAVYFEARGEPIEGQLAVAEVVKNRARSGRYPTSLCAVVKQKAQFSFVLPGGRFPAIAEGSLYWKKAQAVARIAANQLASTGLSNDVLWYHADYVAPTWGRRLGRVNKIGAHIFYRA